MLSYKRKSLHVEYLDDKIHDLSPGTRLKLI